MEKKLFVSKVNKKAVLLLCGLLTLVTALSYLGINANTEKWRDNTSNYRVMWESFKTADLKASFSNALETFHFYQTMQTITIVVGAVLVALCYVSNTGVELVITDKRVYGKAFPGKRVDIPVDSISSVGKGILNTICVASSSGRILFTLLQNSETAFEEVNKLLLTRQENVKNEETDNVVNSIPLSLADEIKKFNQLYQDGILTKEEFDEKKKQLLGL